jgi:lysophospholipase L1-like esterase
MRFMALFWHAYTAPMIPVLSSILLLTIFPPQPAPPRFLALGDSYTIGESVAVSDRWPDQLARALRAKKIDVADPEIIARTGWTTDELSSAIDAANPPGSYALVTLLIGVNNQYRGLDAEQYRKEFVALLKRAIGFAGGDAKRVVVVSIPDWGATPFAAGRDRVTIGKEIDRFNAINVEETRRARAHYADVTPVSRRVATDATLAAPDGLHPSAAMYARWVTVILPQAEAALRGH